MTATDDPAPGLVLTGGGEPTSEELAALVVALTPTAGAAPGPASASGTIPAWTRAALREGTGGPQVASPGSLDELAPRR